jgi:hypothetical protein
VEQFPPNSHASRIGQDGIAKNEEKTDGTEVVEPKRVEQVVVSKVSRRKKPLSKRFTEMFIGGDAQTVGQFIMFEVILPALKDTIADVVSQGIEKMLYGEARSSSRRVGGRPSGQNGYVSYNRYSTGSTPPGRREDPRRPMSRQSRATHNFDEIILATRPEAEEVIDRLFDLVSRYEQATVSDLYNLVGVSGNYTDEKWGWTDLRGAGATRVRNGYLLDLPRPEHLD